MRRTATNIYSLHTGQLTVAYVADVFGGVRRQVETAQAQAELQSFQREGVYITLTSNIALAAIQEASLRAQIAATRRIVALQSRLLDILNKQNERGQIAQPDVVTQETAVAQAKLLLPPLERQLAQQRNLIAVLTGRFPGDYVDPSFDLAHFHLPRDLPLSLPANLVRQRPDIRAAEAAVHAANAQVGVAIANRFPQITLTGNVGSTALAFSQLFSPGTAAWLMAGNVAETVFDAGTLRARASGRRGELAHHGRPVSKHRSRRLRKCRRRVKGVAGRFAHTRRGYRRRGVRFARHRSRAQASRTRPGQSTDPAQRRAGLSPDVIGARAGGSCASRRHRCPVPGARRRLVEQLGGADRDRSRHKQIRDQMSKVRVEVPETPHAPRRRSRVAAACVVALVLLATHVALAPAAPAETNPEPKRDPNTVSVTADQMHQISIVDVASCAFSVQKLAIGQIAFNEDASTVVLTPFSGRVTKLIAKPGDEVKRGDPLFEIDSPEVLQAHTDFIAAVQAAAKSKAQLALAQRALDRQTGLFADHATSQREVEQARNDFTGAESDVKTTESVVAGARNRLRVLMGRSDADLEKVERDRVIDSLVTIKSPIDGTVISRKIGPGQYVRSDSGEALFAISDLSTMWLKAAVPENDIPLIRVGQEIEVKVTAIPDRVFRAKISAIGAASDAATRRVVVRSELPNPDHQLKAEMFASFKITTSEGSRAPAVPVESIIWDGDVATVWVETAPKVFRRRVVQVSTQQDGLVEILQGVHEGEKVVARGAIFVDNEWRQ